jgi:hypothetical protein
MGKQKNLDASDVEKQVSDLLKKSESRELDALEIPEEVRKRIQSSNTAELDALVRELSGVLEPAAGASLAREAGVVEEGADAGDGAGTAANAGFGLPDAAPGPASPADGKVSTDGSFEITVSEDKMRAFLTLVPAKGEGKPLSPEQIRKKLASMKIVFGVNHDLVKQLVESAEKTKEGKSGVRIAQGMQPSPGNDGSVKFLFSESEDALRERVEEPEKEAPK